MAMILKQPGKTGIENYKNMDLSIKNKNHINKIVGNRNKNMKLNSVIFCLCAGLCSSAIINDAFSMDKEMRNRVCKIDNYSITIASKYFENLDDFMNLEMTNSRFCGIANDRLRYNPISIKPNQPHLWPSLETLHLYTDEDIDAWLQAPQDIDDLYKIEVWSQISDKNAVEGMEELKRLVDKSKNTNAKITFRNVGLSNREILGKIKDGQYIFNENVYTNGERKNANFVITEIGNKAFNECNRLKYITIPDSVKSIGDSAFRECTELTSITIHNSVTSIGYVAFCECTGLTSITIPNSLQSIDRGVFFRCLGLTSVTISDSIQSIGEYAFYKCGNAKFVVPHI